MQKNESDLANAVAKVIGKRPDWLELGQAMTSLRTAMQSKDARSMAAAHQGLLARLDAAITRNQLAAGDPNAVLHNVLWQRALFAKLKGDAAARVVKLSDAFIARWDRRQAHRDDFATFVAETFDALAAAVKEQAGGAGDASLDRLRGAIKGNPGNLAALQKAHREVLLEVK